MDQVTYEQIVVEMQNHLRAGKTIADYFAGKDATVYDEYMAYRAKMQS